MNRIAVCIATYQRPALLERLLRSLEDLDPIHPGWELERVVVVDNDQERSAEAVVAEFQGRLPIELTYDVEPEPGISQARNRAVELAGTRFVAFVDDDETVTPNWLNGLIATREKTGAPAVVGRVVNRFEVEPPKWFDEAQLYLRARYPDGALMPGASSSNLLLDLDVRESVGELFDPRFGLLGGSDRHLGLRLQRAELPIVHSADSVVEELISPDRYSMRVLIRRWTRLGSTYVLTDLAVPSSTNDLERRLGHAMVSVGRLTVGLGRAIIGAVTMNRGAVLRSLEMACRGWGGLAALAGTPVSGYPRSGSS